MDKISLSVFSLAVGLMVGGFFGERHGSRNALVGQAQMLGCGLMSEDGKTTVSWRQRADGTCAAADLYAGVSPP